MSKITVSTLITLDGVMEAPGGEPGHPHTGWAAEFMGDAEVQSKCEESQAAGALLLGRVTYESFAEGWSGADGVFGDRMNAMPKYVVSNTLNHPEWNNSKVISGDVIAEIQRLKAETEGELLVCGSRTLAHALMEHNLVDEYRLTIFPVTVGSGFRLFPDSPTKTTLKLIDTRTFASGVVTHSYQPIGSDKASAVT